MRPKRRHPKRLVMIPDRGQSTFSARLKVGAFGEVEGETLPALRFSGISISMSSEIKSLGAVGFPSGAVASKNGDSRAGSIGEASSGASSGSLKPKLLGIPLGRGATATVADGLVAGAFGFGVVSAIGGSTVTLGFGATATLGFGFGAIATTFGFGAFA